MLLIVLFLLVAVIAGVALNFSRRVGSKDEGEGASVLNVLNATGLLAGLLVAIVLSDASSSYSSARKAAKSEADTVDSLYESAEYVDMPARQKIQAAAVCYARAVVGPEWDAMGKGEGSTVPSNWTGSGPNGIRRVLITIGPDAQGWGLIQGGDQTRGGLRSERLTNAKPTVPTILTWFMVVLIGLSLAGLAYSIPRKKNRAHIAALAMVTVLFSLVLLMIYNFDRPFSSVLALKPSAMEGTAADITEDYEEAYGTTLPCDENGAPLTSPAAAPAESAASTPAPPAPAPPASTPATTATSEPQTALDRFLASSTTVPK